MHCHASVPVCHCAIDVPVKQQHTHFSASVSAFQGPVCHYDTMMTHLPVHDYCHASVPEFQYDTMTMTLTLLY